MVGFVFVFAHEGCHDIVTACASPGSPDVDELGVRASKIRVLDESLRDKKGTIGSGGV